MQSSRKLTMPRRKKWPGLGAVASCIARMLHPSAPPPHDKCPNEHKKWRIEGLNIVGEEMFKLNRRQNKILMFEMSHPGF